jgi:metal-dependent amidase/aminoacylase/carboxypeptidase family protein
VVSDLAARQHEIARTIDSLRPLVEDIAVSLCSHPEVGLAETFAAATLTGLLETGGWQVTRGCAGMETAFWARSGDARPALAFMAEYDALPGVGHGCGHNLIAGASLAAAMACRTVLPPDISTRFHG